MLKKVTSLVLLFILIVMPMRALATNEDISDLGFESYIEEIELRGKSCSVWSDYKVDAPRCNPEVYCSVVQAILARTQKIYSKRNCIDSHGNTSTEYKTYERKIDCC